MAGGKKSLFMIIGLVVAVAGVGVGGFLAGKGLKGKEATAAESAINKEVADDAKGESKKETKGEGEGKSEGKSEAKEESGGHGGGHGEAAPEAAKDSTPADLTYTFDRFLLNLLDPSAQTKMSAMISIEAKNADALEKIKQNIIPLRDVTITVLSGKTGQQMMRPEERERAKTELRARYEGRLGPKVINEIYIGDILVGNQ